MRDIINGKLYDTESAEKIGHHKREVEEGSGIQHYRALYQTENGNYFLHETLGDLEEIHPVGEKVYAQAWAERFLSVETVQEHFQVEEA